jgi:hypothetical protein
MANGYTDESNTVEVIERFVSDVGDEVRLGLFTDGLEPNPIRIQVTDEDCVVAEAWLDVELATALAYRILGVAGRAVRDGIAPTEPAVDESERIDHG